MELWTLLEIQPGVTALMGGGGKTTMLYTLAEELRAVGRVVCCTTTHIAVPDHLPVLDAFPAAELEEALEKNRCVCLGRPAEEPGKLAAPTLPMEVLAALADYVLVEADGSRGLPCKAHRAGEPVIPPEAGQIISLVGASCFGKPVREAVHRPEEFWFSTDLKPEDPVTPEAVAELLQTEASTAWPPIKVFVNQVEDRPAWAQARRLAELLSWPVYAGALEKEEVDMLVVIRGAGDIATGVALRLYRAGFQIVMCEVETPTSIRRTVCFSEAVRLGETEVEGVTARRSGLEEIPDLLEAGIVPVLVDPDAECVEALEPDAVVDAILAKRNLGTTMEMAPVVVAVGPGFTAGEDCHAVVETMRGHYLGRVVYEGAALPNTAVPGLIGGYAGERVLRAPADGLFEGVRAIGDTVAAGDVVGYVQGQPMTCTISGTLRGLIAGGVPVTRGMKCGDVDPRCEPDHCACASDKALAVGGGVLEAILCLSGGPDGALF